MSLADDLKKKGMPHNTVKKVEGRNADMNDADIATGLKLTESILRNEKDGAVIVFAKTVTKDEDGAHTELKGILYANGAGQMEIIDTIVRSFGLSKKKLALFLLASDE